MKTPPAFQYYPRDLLCDANVMAMSLEELGAYWKLVSVCWLELGLPGTETGLARLLQIPTARFRKLWPALEPCFILDENGRYQHPRLDRERAKQDEYRATQSEAGKHGAAKRWAKGRHSDPIDSPMANDSSSSSSASSSSKEVPVAPQALADLWNEITTPPLKRCKAMTPKRTQAARARLSERPLEEWREIYASIEASDFCRGSGRDGWVADIDFALRPDTAVKVLEGKYDNRKAASPHQPTARALMGLVPQSPEMDDYHAQIRASKERQAAERDQKASA